MFCSATDPRAPVSAGDAPGGIDAAAPVCVACAAHAMSVGAVGAGAAAASAAADASVGDVGCVSAFSAAAAAAVAAAEPAAVTVAEFDSGSGFVASIGHGKLCGG